MVNLLELISAMLKFPVVGDYFDSNDRSNCTIDLISHHLFPLPHFGDLGKLEQLYVEVTSTI